MKNENPDFRETSSGLYLKERRDRFPGINSEILETSLRYLRVLKLTMKELQPYFDSWNISPGKLTILIALARADGENGLLPSELADRRS